MPMKPPRPCKFPGCPALTRDASGYCPEHASLVSKTYDRTREKTMQQGYATRQWKTLRRMILARDPICKVCGIAPATEVDHIVPKAQGGPDTPENLQGLCKRCHSSKTAREDGRWRSKDYGRVRKTTGVAPSPENSYPFISGSTVIDEKNITEYQDDTSKFKGSEENKEKKLLLKYFRMNIFYRFA